MTPFPSRQVDAGATNMPNPNPSAPEGVQAVRDEMVAEVARALGFAGVSPFEVEDWRIEDFADRLHRAGFRRVVEDDATVERAAEAIHAAGAGMDVEQCKPLARAAVRALREGA